MPRVTERESAAQMLSEQLKQEGVAKLAVAAREHGDAVRGAILFPQQKLGCANCHAQGAVNLLGPDLQQLGPDATDAYLVEAILFPSKTIKKNFESSIVTTNAGKQYAGRIVEQNEKRITMRLATAGRELIVLQRGDVDSVRSSPISAMPDDLGKQFANRQEFLDLIKYMMELRSAGAERPLAPSHGLAGGAGRGITPALEGLFLLDAFQCAACHEPRLTTTTPAKKAPDLSWAAGRIDPVYIERFLRDPRRTKPQTTMPDVMAHLSEEQRKQAAREITHYLMAQSSAFQRQRLDPVAAERGGELFHSVGCVACHSPRNKEQEELLPDDSISLASVPQKYNLNGLIGFLENPHASRPSGRMPNMRLTHWEATELANYLLAGQKETASPKSAFQQTPELAAAGKRWFEQLDCGRCHQQASSPSPRKSVAFAKADTQAGCLSEQKGNWPHYALTTPQRDAIRAAIENPSPKLSDEQQVSLTLLTFNCIACHQRGDLGGVAPDRNIFFKTSNPNLGPQGRIPPTLTGVGGKLNAKWMRQVLVSGRAIRPYMGTRMPQYGTENVAHLVDLLQRVDRSPEVKYARFQDRKEMRNAGHQLVGNTGLNCIACHTFQQKQAATMPAVDLTEMAERLQKSWFYRYMKQPQRLSPNTVMPSFWPAGRSIRKNVLDGDADMQLEALWQYLLDGRQARQPRGLIYEPLRLVAGEEAVMLRRSYGGIGKRGIGVGYPHQVNLAFDAEQLRLAILWKGEFADPGGVWRGQGHGTVRPLGGDQIRFAAGPELDDSAKPWKVDDGRPSRHRFHGYYLDALRRPTFLYRFDDVDVEDYPVDVFDKNSKQAMLVRTLTFSAEEPRPNATFRAAVDSKVVSAGKGAFAVGESLHIRIRSDHQGQIVNTPSGLSLQIPLDIPKGKSKLVLEYQW